uniref:Peptidase C14 caspase domain-containing protein n=1 Tax=Chromera velia CCMP2878 TaxID=1169474 RepID=A0A0G4IBE4_9ALVE|eukprot:Cvel_12801.t1-p1 / transcript=Cvel_12801.t1 / gene=Cvel_12801 / organism=Chromera_velia_CCMP2878 / gene_product=Metacaspase-1, putative / transcript_product=Metacaspase-1, putative / location=Cvel_scaffold852:36605-42290(-) / protein_length=935 / sequence_SO=supercontig / SO=protein_coding / is_pseudo=false
MGGMNIPAAQQLYQNPMQQTQMQGGFPLNMPPQHMQPQMVSHGQGPPFQQTDAQGLQSGNALPKRHARRQLNKLPVARMTEDLGSVASESPRQPQMQTMQMPLSHAQGTSGLSLSAKEIVANRITVTPPADGAKGTGGSPATSQGGGLSPSWTQRRVSRDNVDQRKKPVRASGRRKALLIGIDYVGQGEKALHGRVRDAKLMREVLISHLGFSPADEIVMLLDEKTNRDGCVIPEQTLQGGISELPMANKAPKRDAIIEGLEWLSAGCRRGESRFFFFSGHGIQIAEMCDFLCRPLPHETKLFAVVDSTNSRTASNSHNRMEAACRNVNFMSSQVFDPTQVLFGLDTIFSNTHPTPGPGKRKPVNRTGQRVRNPPRAKYNQILNKPNVVERAFYSVGQSLMSWLNGEEPPEEEHRQISDNLPTAPYAPPPGANEFSHWEPPWGTLSHTDSFASVSSSTIAKDQQVAALSMPATDTPAPGMQTVQPSVDLAGGRPHQSPRNSVSISLPTANKGLGSSVHMPQQQQPSEQKAHPVHPADLDLPDSFDSPTKTQEHPQGGAIQFQPPKEPARMSPKEMAGRAAAGRRQSLAPAKFLAAQNEESKKEDRQTPSSYQETPQSVTSWGNYTVPASLTAKDVPHLSSAGGFGGTSQQFAYEPSNFQRAAAFDTPSESLHKPSTKSVSIGGLKAAEKEKEKPSKAVPTISFALYEDTPSPPVNDKYTSGDATPATARTGGVSFGGLPDIQEEKEKRPPVSLAHAFNLGTPKASGASSINAPMPSFDLDEPTPLVRGTTAARDDSLLPSVSRAAASPKSPADSQDSSPPTSRPASISLALPTAPVSDAGSSDKPSMPVGRGRKSAIAFDSNAFASLASAEPTPPPPAPPDESPGSTPASGGALPSASAAKPAIHDSPPGPRRPEPPPSGVLKRRSVVINKSIEF